MSIVFPHNPLRQAVQRPNIYQILGHVQISTHHDARLIPARRYVFQMAS